MKKILGLDLGVGSIGWALIELDDTNKFVRIIALGSRIVPLNPDDTNEFTSGNAISKNQKRTTKRTQRKGYDRYQLRRQDLTNILRELGMLPDEKLIKLPVLELWQLRANAATKGKKLTLPEIGRVLYHLNQKRGYKHAKSDENADAKQKEYVQNVNQRYANIQSLNKTIGQFFADNLKNSEVITEKGKFYTYRTKEQVFPRKAYEAEFDQIMECQKIFYPEILTDTVIDKIRNEIIYYQRKLKSCKHLVSICEFEKHAYIKKDKNGQPLKDKDGKIIYVNDGPKVAPRTSPLFQVCKIWEEVNALTLKNRKGDELYISQEQRRRMFEHLDNNEKMTLTDMYEILGISKSDGWWGGKAIGKGLQGNTTKMKLKEALTDYPNADKLLQFNLKLVSSDIVDENTGEIIQTISPDFQNEPLYQLWHTIYSIDDKAELANALKNKFGIVDEQTINNLYRLDFKNAGFGNKSARFIRKILPYLQEGLMYSDACEYVGIRHSESLTIAENEARKLLDKLPLIEKNELRQPIVEKILNQMINVVNALIEKHGEIQEIRVELARELKQSKDERNETDKNNSIRKKENEAYAKKIEEFGIRSSRNRIQKYRMWIESEQKCFYCGQPVNVKEFLSGLDVEIEHIIPKSLLFDDSFSNKVCSCRACNSAKNDKTAFDFMRRKPEFEDYLKRVEEYFKTKKISRTKREHLLASYEDYVGRKKVGKETEDDKKLWETFIDRQLRQSQFIARKSQDILKQVCRNVYATSGSVTDFLRHAWGYDEILHNLNFERYKAAGLTEFVEYDHKGQKHTEERIKNWTKRLDHRHHAIDALVIACTKQSFIQRLNNLNTERDAMFAEIEKQSDEWKNKNSLLEQWIKEQQPFSTIDVSKEVDKILISFKAGKKVASTGKRSKYVKNKKVVLQEKIIIPRGSLHAEGVYGSIQQYRKNSEPENRIVKKYKLGIGAQGFLFTGKETYKEETKKDKKSGKDIVKIEDKIKNVIDCIVDNKIRELILSRLNQGFEKGTDYKSDTKKALMNLKNLDSEPIYFDKKHKMPIRTVRCFTNSTSALPSKYNEKGEAISFVEPDNNHHIAIYKDKDGGLHEHVVTFWHAVERKKYGIPVIITNPLDVWEKIQNAKLPESFMLKLPDVNWTFMMSMQQNEMFILGMDDEAFDDAIREHDYALIKNNLYKIQNISEKTYRFCLAIATQFDLKLANKADKRFYNIQSLPALFKLNPHKVHITLLGQVLNNND